MKVIEHIDNAKDPLFSFEIIPPIRGKSAQEIIDIVKDLEPFNPPFIDVTSHPAEAYYEENTDGEVKRRVRKKRPGTELFRTASKLIQLPIYYAGVLHGKKPKMQLLN